jgi:Protein of unknown function (DUF3592)
MKIYHCLFGLSAFYCFLSIYLLFPALEFGSRSVGVMGKFVNCSAYTVTSDTSDGNGQPMTEQWYSWTIEYQTPDSKTHWHISSSHAQCMNIGSSIEVYYNPQKPSNSLLSKGGNFTPSLTSLFLTILLFVLAINLRRFIIWEEAESKK